MREQGFGHIINTASIAGLFASPLGSSTMTKHGVVGISKALRIEAARYGVRVSALCPGVIRTPILQGGKYGRKRGLQLSESRMAELWARMRPMDADEFARQALRKIDRNVAIIVVPSSDLALWLIERLSVGLSLAVGLHLARKAQALFDAEGVPAPPDEDSPGRRTSSQ